MVSRRTVVLGGLAFGASAALPFGRAFGQSNAIVGPASSAMAKASVPGLSYAIIRDGAVTERGALGVKQVGKFAVVDANTRFQAASLSKTINALCVLTLVRDGKIGLDDPVNQHLKDWKLSGRNDAGKVTVRMLLSHSGGVNVHGFAGYGPGERFPTTREILDGAPPANSEAVRVVSRPGRAFKYSGGGSVVLQRVVSDVVGGDYPEIVRERVLSPLGMNQSAMRQPPASSDNLAHGHGTTGSSFGWNVYPELAAAGLWTTPGDLGRALVAIMNSINGEPGAFLPPAVGKQINKPAFGGAALGVFVDGGGRISHSGVNAGFRAVYVVSPKRKRGYVIMSNGENGEALNEKIAGMLLKEQGWRSV